MKKLFMILLIAASAFVLCGVDAGKCMADPGSSGQPFQTLFFAGTESCSLCHSEESSTWADGAHANSQSDVATELAGSHAGETPQEVAQSENCIACHAPTAVLTSWGMSEATALDYFFTTVGGKFTADTVPANSSQWPHISCKACHNANLVHWVPQLKLSAFNSSIRRYENGLNANTLCGQCHGNLRFTDTDHLLYNGWTMNKHSQTQQDVATELAGSHAGETPQEVAQSENCIACHAPTAVLANGGMSEAKALSYFFTTQNGKYTAGTSPQRDSQWPGVGCADCHDPHSAKGPVYFNSATKKYESFDNTNQLCGQCHGNLRFPDTDHLSYNIEKGTGGVGVPEQQTMPGVMCTDCHMYTNKQDGSNSTKYAGHSFAVMINEADGTTSTSCTNCHATLDAAASSKNIDQWKSEFQTLDAQAQDLVGKAQTALTGINDPTLQNKLDEAQKNLSYAESDESGGFHNHKFLMALLNDAVTRAQEILKQVGKKS